MKMDADQRARCNELEELDVETLAALVVELEAKGFWRCKCGVEAMPLTDNTICRCADLYDQEWHFIPGARSC
jgi:hypothetical protein